MYTYEEYKECNPDSKLTAEEFSKQLIIAELALSNTTVKFLDTDTACVKQALCLQLQYFEENPNVLSECTRLYTSVGLKQFSYSNNMDLTTNQKVISPFAYMQLQKCGLISSVLDSCNNCWCP